MTEHENSDTNYIKRLEALMEEWREHARVETERLAAVERIKVLEACLAELRLVEEGKVQRPIDIQRILQRRGEVWKSISERS